MASSASRRSMAAAIGCAILLSTTGAPTAAEGDLPRVELGGSGTDGETLAVPQPGLLRSQPGRPDLELPGQPQTDFQPMPKAEPQPIMPRPLFGRRPGDPIFGRRPGDPIFTPGE